FQHGDNRHQGNGNHESRWLGPGGSSMRSRMFFRPMRVALFAGLMFLAPLLARAADKEPTATLDVKDEDIRVVFQSLKEQCGVRNLLIDKDVSGKATFYLHDVPCTAAFEVVARTMSLAYDIEPNSVVSVRPRR